MLKNNVHKLKQNRWQWNLTPIVQCAVKLVIITTYLPKCSIDTATVNQGLWQRPLGTHTDHFLVMSKKYVYFLTYKECINLHWQRSFECNL